MNKTEVQNEIRAEEIREREERAAEYSEKCARLRRRKKKRQREMMDRLLRFSMPFSLGVFALASFLALCAL